MTVLITLLNAWVYFCQALTKFYTWPYLNVVSFAAISVETLTGLILWYKEYWFKGQLSLSNEMNLG